MHSIGNSICDWGGIIENLQAILCGSIIKWVSAIMSPKMFVPEMSTVPKCLFP